MENLINPSCLHDVENNLALCSFEMVLCISDEIMTERSYGVIVTSMSQARDVA